MPLFGDSFKVFGTDRGSCPFKELYTGACNGSDSVGFSFQGDSGGDAGGLGVVTTWSGELSTKGAEQDREARAREASHSGADNGRAYGDGVSWQTGSRVGVRAGEG